MVQERMKMYYNKKRSEGPDLKERDKVWLLHKNFEKLITKQEARLY